MKRREFLLILGGLVLSREALGQEPSESDAKPPSDDSGGGAEEGETLETEGEEAGSEAQGGGPLRTRVVGSEGVALDDAFFPTMVGGWPR